MMSLELPDGLGVVKDSWFARSPVQRVVFPASIRIIQAHAFAGCVNLQTVVFRPGSHLETIGMGAFAQSGLVNFWTPSSLRRVCQNAFY